MDDIDIKKQKIFEEYRRKKLPAAIINKAYVYVNEHFYGYHKCHVLTDLLYRKNLLSAEKMLKNCLKAHSPDQEERFHIYCILGRINAEKYRHAQSIEYYEKASQIKNDSAEVLCMLSYEYILVHDYPKALMYMNMLSDVLHLGPDMAENLDIISDECPFPRFPYYQLYTYISSFIQPGKAAELSDRIISLTINTDEPLFPSEEIILLCLHQGKDYVKHLDLLFKQTADDPAAKNAYVMSAIYYMLTDIGKGDEKLRDYRKTAAGYITKRDRLAFCLKRIHCKSSMDTVIKYRLYVISNEPHFVDKEVR